MKRAAILCQDPDQRLMAAFINCMTAFSSPTYRTWLAYTNGYPGMADRTRIEHMAGGRPVWIRLSPPRPPKVTLGRGGRQRCFLSWLDEVAFVEELERRALTGEEITAGSIARELARRTGRTVSKQAVSELLRRQGLVRVGIHPLWDRLADKGRRQDHRRRRGALLQAARETVDHVVEPIPHASGSDDRLPPGPEAGSAPVHDDGGPPSAPAPALAEPAAIEP